MRIFKPVFFILTFLAIAFFLLLWVHCERVPVLMYHFVDTKEAAREDSLIVSEETFQKHLHWLKSWGYRVYSLEEFTELKSKNAREFQKGVVLTFDDGNRDFVERVFPILNQEKVSAAGFLIWHNVSQQAMGSMSIEQAKELLKSPLVTLGVHSFHHKELIGLSEGEYREEIMEAKNHLEDALGAPLFYFSYPSGYFDDRAKAYVGEAGYRLAFTTSAKRLRGQKEDQYSLTRVKITEADRNPIFFWFKVSGLSSSFDRFKWQFLTTFHVSRN